jgi:hypothetical protein
MCAEESQENPSQQPDPINQEIQHAPISARVPPGVAKGVFSTGAIVFEGPNEFVIDFVLRLGAPHAITSRVVLSHMVFGQFAGALRENVKMFTERFGPPPALPAAPPPADPQNTISELYEQLKLPDEMLSGVYANGVMIGHSPAEFWFDFITNFYPRSVVSSRVFLAAQQIPGLLQTLDTSLQAYQRKHSGGQPPAGPREPPSAN